MQDELDILFEGVQPIELDIEERKVKVMNLNTKTWVNTFAVVGFLSVLYQVGCLLQPDKLVYSNMKGINLDERVYVRNIIANCGNRNPFNLTIEECQHWTAAYTKLRTGEPPDVADTYKVSLTSPPIGKKLGNAAGESGQ